MSPYQRAAAVAVAPRPVLRPAPQATPDATPQTTPAASRRRWPGRGDRVAQAVLACALAVVLAAMAVNRLDGFLDLVGHTPGARDAAMRTWSLDVVTAGALAGVGVVHSAVRRGRPGRWPVTVLGLAVAASVVLVPVFAG